MNNDELLSGLPDQGPATSAPIDPIENLPDRGSQIEQAYRQSLQVEPVHAAKVITYSDKLAASPSQVSQDLTMAERVANTPSSAYWAEFENKYPGTTKYLTKNPQIVPAVRDDIQSTADHETLVQKISNFLDSESKAWQSGSKQDELNMLSYQKLMGANDPSIDTRMNQLTKDIGELGAEAPKSGLAKGVYGATEFLPQMASQFAYGAKYAAPLVGAAGLAGLAAGPGAPFAEAFTVPTAIGAGLAAGSLEYNFKAMSGAAANEFSQMRDKDGKPLPPEVVKVAALATGAAASGLGLLQFGNIVKMIPGGKQFMDKFVSQAGTEVLKSRGYAAALGTFAKEWAKSTAHGVATMEGITATNIVGGELAKVASGQNFDPASWDEIKEKLVSTAKDASLTFGVMAFPGAAMGLAKSSYATRIANNAKEFDAQMEKKAVESKMKQRLPDQHTDLVKTITENTPVENVYLPVQAAETYFQSKGIDPQKAAEAMGIGDQYKVAKLTGEDLKIPYSKWSEKIHGTEHAAGLRDDIKFSREDLSVNQAKATHEQNTKLFQEESAKAADLSSEDKIAAESKQKVYDTVAQELKNAGRPETMNAAQWKTYIDTQAKTWSSAMEAQAKAKGISIEEQFSRSMPKVLSESQAENLSKSPYRKSVLERIQSEIAAGDHEKGGFVPSSQQELTNDGKFIPSTSTFPEYFQKKGYSKEETIKALDKALSGKDMTMYQAQIVNDLYRSSGYHAGFEKQDPFFQSQIRPVTDPSQIRDYIKEKGKQGSAIHLTTSDEINGKTAQLDPLTGHLSIATDKINNLHDLDSILNKYDQHKAESLVPTGHKIEVNNNGKAASVNTSAAVRELSRQALNLKKLIECVGIG